MVLQALQQEQFLSRDGDGCSQWVAMQWPTGLITSGPL